MFVLYLGGSFLQRQLLLVFLDILWKYIGYEKHVPKEQNE